MARPTKYKFNEARKMDIECVYIFLDENKPIYVGKTRNMKRRFQPYFSKKSHNEKLNIWLQKKNHDFIVEVYTSNDIGKLEKKLIEKHKHMLFNISNGCENDWYLQNKEQKPWVAGRGILSPISQTLREMKSSKKKESISLWVKKLSDKQRSLEEVSLAMLNPKKHSKWLDLTSDKLIACLES